MTLKIDTELTARITALSSVSLGMKITASTNAKGVKYAAMNAIEADFHDDTRHMYVRSFIPL